MTRQTRPTHCQGCDKPFRKRSEKARDFPGTQQYAGKGLCTYCAKVTKNGKPTKSQRAQKAMLVDGQALTDKRNTDAFLKKISTARQRLEQRKKVRMVIR